jgi:predicted nuclease of restriction endonuclease-like (RecB) superfamily
MAKKKSQPVKLTKRPSKPVPTRSLLGDLRQLIEAAREQTARAVNSTLVTMYWQIGKRIREDVLQNQRAEYGDAILQTLSEKLTEEYGRGFSEKSLWHMMRFAEVFPDEEIVSALRRQLSWTHFKELIYLDDPLKREFYAELCRVERWSTRTLRHKIGHLLYERTAVSRKRDVLIAKDIAALPDEDRLTPDMVFRDPYFLDFLGLSGQHVELLRLNDSGIRIAQYLTELPPKKLLEKKLHDSIRLARERLARGENQRQNFDHPETLDK